MAVGKVKPEILVCIFQNKTLIKSKIGEQRFVALCVRTEVRRTHSVAVTAFFLFHIMVPVNQIQPSGVIKQGQEPEHVVVDFDNLAHFPVFPELIPVSQLDIGKTAIIIVFQGGKIKILVFQKIIVGISAASVAVADKDIAAAHVQGQYGRIMESAGKTGIIAHKGLLKNGCYGLNETYMRLFLPHFLHLQYRRGFNILRKAKGRR